MSQNIIFLGHDELASQDVRRTVRARAAEHSHRSGERKPKASKNPNARKRRPKTKLSSPHEMLLRRDSTASIAASTTTQGTEGEEEEEQAAVQSRSQTPHMTRIGAYKEDPFEAYPVPAQPWFAELLDYMWPFMLRGWSALHTTDDERRVALSWVQELTLSDPCYFYMNMLSVSGDLASRGTLQPQMIHWHRSEVVKSINEALADTEKALTVGTILSVGRIALHEIILGDITAGIRFHRPAFARMIVMAGGLDALNLPSLVRSHLGWANRLMTMKTGVNITDLESSLLQESAFNEGRDSREDVAVLDQYMPNRQMSITLPERPAQGRHAIVPSQEPPSNG